MALTYKEREQEQLIGYWAKTIGISKQVLDKHPCIDDIILLMRFREATPRLSKYNYKLYRRIYDSVYTGRIPLKQKQLQALERIVKKSML
jgi:hypothetical protein